MAEPKGSVFSTEADNAAVATAEAATAVANTATARANGSADEADIAITNLDAKEAELQGKVDLAQTARAGAETARTGAETARSGAESAKVQSESAAEDAAQSESLASQYANGGIDPDGAFVPRRLSALATLEATPAPNAGERSVDAVGLRYAATGTVPAGVTEAEALDGGLLLDADNASGDLPYWAPLLTPEAPVTPAMSPGATSLFRTSASLLVARKTGRGLVLPRGIHDLSPQRITEGSVDLRGQYGSVLRKASGTIGLHVEPLSGFTGTATGGTLQTVTIQGGGLTPGEWAGHVLTIDNSIQQAGEPAGTFHRQNRWIVGNTADTVELARPLSEVPASGKEVNLYKSVDEVVLGGFALDGQGLGGAGAVLRFVKRVVVLPGLHIYDNLANGLTFDTCLRVECDGLLSERNQFGVFALNCDDTVIHRATCRDSTNTYNIQMKDCRNSSIEHAVVSGGTDGVNIKSSGLNPTYNVRIEGASADGCGANGVIVHALKNEGEAFAARNYSVHDVASTGCGTNFLIVEDFDKSGLLPGFRGTKIQSDLAGGIGVSIQADGVTLDGVTATRSDVENLEVKAADVVISRVTTQDRLTTGPEVSIEGQRSRVNGLRTVRTTEGASTLPLVFLSSSADNVVTDPGVVDPTGAWPAFMADSGTRNTVVGDVPDWTAPGLTLPDVVDVRWARPSAPEVTVAVDAGVTINVAALTKGAPSVALGQLVKLNPSGGFVVQIANLQSFPVGTRVRLVNTSSSFASPIRLTGGPVYEDGSVNGSGNPQKSLPAGGYVELVLASVGAAPTVRWVGP